MAGGGRGISSLVLITGLLTFLNPTAMAEPDSTTPDHCASFQTSGFFRNNDLHVQYLLYTPSNPTCGQFIKPDNIENSTFDAALGTKIIIHGFRVLGTKPSWIDKMVESLLVAGPVNVVAVDWVYGSTALYNQAVENVPKLGLEIVALINRFLELGSTTESLHLIGASLGAHVAGHVGHLFGGRIGRITGLDPAGYKFRKNIPKERLDPADAEFVEAIHTDTDNFGIRIAVGHVDYFINGGRDQPGCTTSLRNLYGSLICDHMRSIAVFINAIRGDCQFIGFPCANYQMFQEGRCVDCGSSQASSCPRIGVKRTLITTGGDILLSKFRPEMENSTDYEMEYFTNETEQVMGNDLKEILYFMLTTTTEPYCAHHILLEFTLTAKRENSITIEIQLINADSSSSKSKITVPKQTMGSRRLVAHRDSLCHVKSVAIKVSSTISRLWRRAPEFTGKLCIGQLPMNRRNMICLPDVLAFSDHSSQTHPLPDAMQDVCQ
ncbi:phospholipase A1 member A [Pseudophryne corroboree]|uniref:phospholipase A1 member A n=1 Tax=Pseudophryne corroboree TaxID=495146 RepID=UPI003081EF56